MRPEIYMIRLYRVTPGDVGIRDLPLFEGEDLEAAAGECLLSYFTDQRQPARERPHHADVVRENGTVAMRLMVNVQGHVQRIPELAARR